jgi:hypothetical protein
MLCIVASWTHSSLHSLIFPPSSNQRSWREIHHCYIWRQLRCLELLCSLFRLYLWGGQKNGPETCCSHFSRNLAFINRRSRDVAFKRACLFWDICNIPICRRLTTMNCALPNQKMFQIVNIKKQQIKVTSVKYESVLVLAVIWRGPKR